MRTIFVSITLACVAGLHAAAAEKVQLFHWQNVNIQGMGYVTGMVIQPNAPYDVYIRTDVGGAYRFDRTASRWIPLLDGLATQAGIGTESVAIDPQSPKRVYAVINRVYSNSGGKYTYAGDVIVSEDRGTTWRSTGFVRNNVYAGPNDDYRIETGERLAVDPNNASILYFASRRNGLWKGTRQPDDHYSWSQITAVPVIAGDPAGHTFVVFDPSTASRGVTQTIYVGVHGSGVWDSNDGGKTWANTGRTNNPARAAIASDGTLYVSFATLTPASGAVYKLHAGQWTDISPSDKSGSYTGISVDPTNPATVMVGRDGNVWRSTNAGASWSSQKMVMHQHDPYSAGSNPSAPGYYLSTTAGASGGVAALVIDPANPKQVWWTNGWGVARTDDVTATQPFWAWQMNNLEELVGVMVRVPPKPQSQGGADLVSMTMDMIGFRHADKDTVPGTRISPAGIPFDPNPSLSWQPNLFGGTTYPVPWPHVSMGSSLDYSYYHPDSLAFVGHLQWQAWPVYGYSNDNGATWTAFPTLPTEMLWSNGTQLKATPIGGQIAMSSANSQNMVWVPTWGTFDGGSDSAAIAPWPHYTTDGGQTWSVCKLAQPPAKPSPYDPHNNDHVHYDALPRAWANSIHPYVSTNLLSADRNDPDGKTFYYFDGHYTNDGNFYYSNDGGATWNKSQTGGFPGNVVNVNLVSNPTKRGDVWMALGRNSDDVNGHLLYHSSDGGQTFTTINTLDICDKITFGRGNSDSQPFMYALGRANGARRDAIYKSEDGGQTWVRLSNPDTNAFMNVAFMEADMRTPNLVYVALSGRGIMYGTLPAGTPATPQIKAGGVANGASFTTQISRGSVASLFGDNLAGGIDQAAVVPLPISLSGVEVTVDDQPAPLWFVSAGQINFQMPWEAPSSGSVEVRVYNGDSASDAVTVPIQPNAPGVFGYTGADGSREAIMTHADYSLVTQAKPAKPGEELIVWMTGLGNVATIPDSGFGAPAGDTATATPTATLGGSALLVTYAGLTTGAIGLAQVQVKLPPTLPAGNPLLLSVALDSASSDPVPVWVLQ